jgi:hypothetical protein
MAKERGSTLEIILSPNLQTFFEEGPAKLCLDLLGDFESIRCAKKEFDSSMYSIEDKLYESN